MGNNEEYPNIDDIGLIPLLENCKELKRIAFEFRFDSLIDSLIKWTEVISDSSKRSIIFQTCLLKEHMERVLSDMSRLENLQILEISNSYHSWTASRHCNIIDKPMTIPIQTDE